jgi:probable rRNA maturation factor
MPATATISLPFLMTLIMLSSRLGFASALVQRAAHRHRLSTTRLFAVGTGEIGFFDEQKDLKVDAAKMVEVATKIRSLLGYDTYGLTLMLVDDEAMREANEDSRGVDAPTDILSFPMHEAIKPGLLQKPQFDIPDMHHLGDILVDVPYVTRQRNEDMEWEYEEDDDRGVSAAMVDVECVETRIHMLLVHGMLHLVGYDHMNDADFQCMADKEEEFLEKLGLPVIKKQD